jgi:hypothetical protein
VIAEPPLLVGAVKVTVTLGVALGVDAGIVAVTTVGAFGTVIGVTGLLDVDEGLVKAASFVAVTVKV